MMKTKEYSRKSLRNLAQTINSLLRFKTHTTSSWADSVCDIIKSLPQTQGRNDDLADDCEKDLDDLAISKINGELAALSDEVHRLNAQRRQLLNDFLELKGNIRVFCRVRPIIAGERFGNLRPVVVPVDSNGVLLNFAENKTKMYNFDKVFHPGSSQDEVFLEIEPVIKSALDGYNVCILAYGQTGTGKTFTMEGTPDYPGVVPCTIEALFKQAADSNHKYFFSFSMLEIYLGHLKDLLIPQAKKPTDPMPPCLSIQTDPSGEIAIDNLAAIQVSEFNQAIRLYRLGSHFRSTASTNSNEASSRSHCMIRISITCFDDTERRKITNKIWMVDLGGSERVLKTKAWGRRFEEGKAINLSLSALGDVINALQRKKSHIPYRNSKLTQVLKDSLGEDSRTLMLVHVSPREEDLCETVCSLNFAVRLRSIHLGKKEPSEAKAQREAAMTNLQQKMQQIEDKRDEVRKEIKNLHQKLESLKKMPSASNEKLYDSQLLSEVPQPNEETLEKIENVATAPLSTIPRFMRPTICSRRKTGMDHQTSKEREMRPARRKRLTSSRAESVTFPMKGMSECNSESSISRASCLVGLNGICNADIETECSQDTSQCDFRIAFVEQDESPKSSTYQMVHSSLNKDHIELNSPKFSKVDQWLRLHKNTTNSSSYPHQNKRVLAIPTPEKKSTSKGQIILEKLQDREMHDNKFTKIKRKHDHFKKLGNGRITEMPESETARNLRSTVVSFAGHDARFNSIASLPGTDGIKLTKEITGVHDKSTEGDSYNNFNPPENIDDRSRQYKNVNGAHGMPTQVKAHETIHLEDFALENTLNVNVTASDIDSSVIGIIEGLNASISISEPISHSKEVLTELSGSCEELLHVSAQCFQTGKNPCLNKVITPRGSPVDKLNQRDLTMPFPESLQNTTNSGIYDFLKQKNQILYNSALLALGFQSLGFEHGFFQALML